MATQSLYRRYRPRRFSELKGQDHVVRALRNAVASGREGQAYLFSGPRGTGKTTSARILAKVLNCANPVDGEPCCECESCLAVERGTSYDVHELDAASNNGVDAMRDLIERAALGTPGRHKVYILDEVHMLSKAAEAALLKTLEEPPPHVVFVLATTDPQKVSETIRSRTQHLQFHLLPIDTLDAHIRWVAADAGLELTEAMIESVLSQGGGSARDTLSALELVANSGDDDHEPLQLDELVEALVELDPRQALTAIAHAIQLGREPRALTEELIRHLRNGFLSLMAPELAQLPSHRVDTVAAQAHRLGAAGVVRAIEGLGAALVEMRHAPDPRVLLEVAVVQLTHEHLAATDTSAILGRLDRLEKAIAERPGAVAAPTDPVTGRAAVGGRARAVPSDASPDQSDQPDTSSEPAVATAAVSAATAKPPGSGRPAVAAQAPAPAAVSSRSAQPVAETAAPAGRPLDQLWDSEVRPALRGMVKALYSTGRLAGRDGEAWVLEFPNDATRDKAAQHRAAAEAVAGNIAGTAITLSLVVEGAEQPATAGSESEASTGTDTTEEIADIDLDALTDAPASDVQTPLDKLAEAFPGSELIEDRP